MDIRFLEEYIAGVSGLPQVELVWPLGWNIARGGEGII
jgi:hypothetical protein